MPKIINVAVQGKNMVAKSDKTKLNNNKSPIPTLWILNRFIPKRLNNNPGII